MADTRDIYQRFLRAPLRLKTEHPPPPSPAPSALPSPRDLPVSARHRKPTTARSSTMATANLPEVKRLRRRVAKIRVSTAREDDADPVVVLQPSDTESSSATSPTATRSKGPQGPLEKRKPLKKKRVTRAAKLRNTDTGGDFVDTPTKAGEPPKRSRRAPRGGSTSANDASDVIDHAQNARVNRNLGASLLDADSDASEDEELKLKAKPAPVASKPEPAAGPGAPHTATCPPQLKAETRPVRRSRRLQQSRARAHASAAKTPALPAAPPLDALSTLCDSLVATHTISGCFFALALNALRPPTSTLSFPTNSRPFQSVFDICLGIAQCEKLAQHAQTPAQGLQSSWRRRHDRETAIPTRKKSVRFQSFDLSCLSLQYVEDERMAATVDELLARYGRILELIQTTLAAGEQQKEHVAALRELARVMISPTIVFRQPAPTGVALKSHDAAAKRIFTQAFGSRDAATQHEIRVCGDFFAGQFASLLAPRVLPAAPPQFLQRMFSCLVSSSSRFKLRVLFLADCVYDDDGERVQETPALDAQGRPLPAMATYAHQDLGAAVHCALQETLLYTALVRPVLTLLAVVGTPESSSDSSVVLPLDPSMKKPLDDCSADDLDRMEQYVLARRFLRFQLTKSWNGRKEDQFAAETWHSLEQACAIAKRSNFEDEAHFFPLATMDAFLAELADEEPSLRRLEKTLQVFRDREGTIRLRPEPCMECHRIITRLDDPTSIKCILCGNRYHLRCLHLPDTFAQFAGQYTCPTCFLGRGY